MGSLQTDSFAEVRVDRLNVRTAPGLKAELALMTCFGYPTAECPPALLGRDTPQNSVYVLDGPVRADGYEWYLVTTGYLAPDVLGWVASGDADDAWLVPLAVDCPKPPVELADVTFTALPPLEAVSCLGGQELTLRGYYTAPPEDATGSFEGHMLRTVEAGWYGDGSHLELVPHPDLGAMPPRPGWIEVSGQFDHPISADRCGDDGPPNDIVAANLLVCRVSFVVTSARAVEPPQP